jgi:hypothetical protein
MDNIYISLATWSSIRMFSYLAGAVLLVAVLVYRHKLPLYKRELLKRATTSKAHNEMSTKSQTSRPIPLDYKNVFPPSRREVVTRLLPAGSNTAFHDGDYPSTLYTVDDPTTTDYYQRSVLKHEGFSSTLEFRADEIRALGDFPQYDTITGVRLPKPYHDFDYSTALPRPYRPFRWGYQQTMGKSIHINYLAYFD